MAIINYDVSIEPTAPTVTLALSAGGQSLSLKVDSISAFSVSISPSLGSVALSAVMGGVGVGAVYAVAKGGEKFITETIHRLIGVEVGFGPIAHEFDLHGVNVKVTAEALSLETFHGMLLAEAAVVVS